MVEDQRALLFARFQFKMHNRVDAGIPVRRPPGLDNSLTRDKFNCAPYDESAKHREGPACRSVDRRWQSRKSSKLLLVDNHFIKALWTRFEVKLVMN